MEHNYTSQLIQNLKEFYNCKGLEFVHYPNIKTIRIILPVAIDLKPFAKNLFNDLSALPEIDHEREMVYFWICQEGTADFYKELINPTKQAEIDWSVVGTGPGTWVPSKDLNK